jgi:hypothetical protein
MTLAIFSFDRLHFERWILRIVRAFAAFRFLFNSITFWLPTVRAISR